MPNSAHGADESGLLRRDAPFKQSRRSGRRERWRDAQWLMGDRRMCWIGSNGRFDRFLDLFILRLVGRGERRTQGLGVLLRFALPLLTILLSVRLAHEGIQFPDSRPVRQLGEGGDALLRRGLR